MSKFFYKCHVAHHILMDAAVLSQGTKVSTKIVMIILVSKIKQNALINNPNMPSQIGSPMIISIVTTSNSNVTDRRTNRRTSYKILYIQLCYLRKLFRETIKSRKIPCIPDGELTNAHVRAPVEMSPQI